MTFPVEEGACTEIYDGGAYTEIYDDEDFDEDGRPKRTGKYIYGEACASHVELMSVLC